MIPRLSSFRGVGHTCKAAPLLIFKIEWQAETSTEIIFLIAVCHNCSS